MSDTHKNILPLNPGESESGLLDRRLGDRRQEERRSAERRTGDRRKGERRQGDRRKNDRRAGERRSECGVHMQGPGFWLSPEETADLWAKFADGMDEEEEEKPETKNE
jgi:hypothetical protein